MSLTAPVRLRVLPKLIPLDGKSVEMQATDTALQWRLVGSDIWTDVVPLSDITGPQGPKGDTGQDGTMASVVAGLNVSIDSTDPANPIISAAGDVSSTATDASTFGFVAGKDATPADTSKVLPTVERVDVAKLQKAATRTVLKGLSGTTHPSVYLMEAGRDGVFKWDSSDLSAEVTLDTLEGFYVAPTSDTTGASGAWVRQRDSVDIDLDVRWFGAAVDGTTDDTDAVQAAIDLAHGLEVGTVAIPAGDCAITSLTPKSFAPIRGAGVGQTKLIINSAEAYKQVGGTQLFRAGVTDLTFSAGTGFDDAVVLTLTAAQECQFLDLSFEGFLTGTILKIESQLTTVWDDHKFDTNSNTIWNTFANWVSYGCANGLVLAGSYGTSTPVGSDSPVPNAVVTANNYRNMKFYKVTTKGIDIVKACDTEMFYDIWLNISGDNGIHIDLHSDDTYSGNNYVNSHKFFGLVCSKLGTLTGVTVLKSLWTFGNAFYIEHDMDVSLVTAIDMADALSYLIEGKRLDTTTTTDMEVISKGLYHRLGSGTEAKPIISFDGDEDTGIFHVSADALGIGVGGNIKATVSTSGLFGVSKTGAGVAGTQRLDAHGVATIAAIPHYGTNAAGSVTQYAQVTATALDNTTGSEDAQWSVSTKVGGVATESLWVRDGAIAIRDGVTAPPATTGMVKFYVDAADGDLKVIFGDGTIKTLTADT